MKVPASRSRCPRRLLSAGWMLAVFMAVGFLTVSMPASAASSVVKAAAQAGWRAFLRHPSSLPDEQISRMAGRALRPGGISEVGEELGRLKLPDAALEDAYLRMIVHQNRLSRKEAEGIYEALRGTDGFRTTLRKVAGANDAMSTGHLNELRIARSGIDNGLKVRGIGVRFDDQLKKAATDIDVLMEYRGRTLAVEAKDYQHDTRIPLDSFRADMDSLVQYGKLRPEEKVLPVFTITNKPGDKATLKLLEAAARQRGIALSFGSPDKQTYEMKTLVDIDASP